MWCSTRIIMGALLFIIYVNDICNISNLLFKIMYADDTSVLFGGNNENGLICLPNKEFIYFLFG